MKIGFQTKINYEMNEVREDMRQKKILVSLMIVFFMSTFLNIRVEGATKGYQTLKTIKNVEMLKEFKIRFSENLNPNTVNTGYIKVYTDEKNPVRQFVKIELDKKNKDTIIITPVNRYKQGVRYKIIVESGLESEDGENLGKGFVIPFEVKNFYAGLPVEGGILILGNESYSIEYIAKNSAKKNEILRGNYQVFYINEKMKNRIKNVIGGEFVDGTELPPGYNFKKPMYHTDAEGERHMYIWNYEKSEFVEVEASIRVKSTVNMNTLKEKVVMVKVEQVNYLEGAAYYKLNSSTGFVPINEPSIFSVSELGENITLYSKSMTKLATTDLFAAYEGTYTRKLRVFEATPEGNSPGNIINNGYVAADENGYVVYNNTGDGNRLYRNDINGIFHNVISDDYAQYINVSNEWIYYSNYTDKGKLYRMKIDGSAKEKLTDDSYVAFINIIGDSIYYSNYSNGGQITRINRDGSGTIIDSKGMKRGKAISLEMEDEAYFLNIVGDWIYYVNISDHHRIYKVNKNGKFRSRLSDEGASSIQVVDDWIYYTNSRGELRKVRKNGSKETEDIDGVVTKFKRGYFFNVVDDWIYYSNADDSSRLYKIKVDGTGKQRISRQRVSYISVAYNTIYYVSDGVMFTLPTDADDKTRPVAVKKVENKNKIVVVDDVIEKTVAYDEVNKPIEWLESKYLDTKVSGILSDNKMRQFVVQWDTKGAVTINGVREYRGKLIGYNQFIKFRLTIPSEMLNETTTISVYNNPGTRTGQIEVYSDPVRDGENNNPPKLSENDVITIYADEKLSVPLRIAAVQRNGIYNKAIFSNFDLDRYGIKKYYMSIKRQGKAPSKGTEFTIGEAPVITNSIHKPVRDLDKEGLGIDGRDFFIEELEATNNKTVLSSKIYLTRRGAQLRIQNRNLVPFDEKNVVGDSWIGREYQDDSVPNKDKVPMNIDSMGNVLNVENYDLFMVCEYVDKAGADSRGQSPTIRGWAVSEPASIQVESEELPTKPTINSKTYKYGDVISLGIVPKAGEQAFLIPVWENKFDNDEHEEYDYHKFLVDDKERNISKVGIADSKNWLEIARVWLKEDGDWPFDEDHPAINESIITRLDGDGKQREIRVPKGVIWSKEDEQQYYDEIDNMSLERVRQVSGMDNLTAGEAERIKIKLKNNVDKYYAPNIKYKLVIKNSIGVSYISDGLITVDNKPPVVVREYHEGDVKTRINAGSLIKFQSRNEKATVYITYTEDHLDNIEELEDAISVGRVFKYGALSGVTRELYTDNIKARLMDGRDRFLDGKIDSPKKGYIKIGVADDVGNIRFIEGLTKVNGQNKKGMYIYIDNRELEKMYDAAKYAKKTSRDNGFVFDSNVDELNQQYKKIEELEKMIESDNLTVYTNQREVDNLVEQSKEKLIDLGIPYEGVEERARVMRNYLLNLRGYNDRDIALNLDSVETDIYLPRELKYKDEKIGDIEWSVIEGGDGWFKINGEKGEVKESREPNPKDHNMKLMAKYIPVEDATGTKVYEITIKARKFNTIVDALNDQFAIIYKRDVNIEDTSDISVKIKNPATDRYEDTVEFNGIRYSVVPVNGSTRGGDYDIELHADILRSEAQTSETMDIQITIDNVTFNNQIRLEVKDDGTSRLVNR